MNMRKMKVNNLDLFQIVEKNISVHIYPYYITILLHMKKEKLFLFEMKF